MRLEIFKVTGLALLVGLFSCTGNGGVENGVHKNSLAITAVENIQMSFDLASGKDSSYIKFASSKGNVFVIEDLNQLKSYVNENKQYLLLSDNYLFLWDTLKTSKNLYLLDKTKSHFLNAKSTTLVPDSVQFNSIELLLPANSRAQLSTFFADNIGKGLVLLDRNGFVASAENISKLNDGNLRIQK